MRKSITIILILAILAISIIALVGCYGTKTESNINGTSMFVIIEKTGSYRIVYHKETLVMYAVSCSCYNYGNFTLLVNADGTPMLYEE